MPGDANSSGRVTSADVGLTSIRRFTTFSGSPNTRGFTYDIFFDINSTATITSADVGLTSLQSFDTLPAAPPAAPVVPKLPSKADLKLDTKGKWDELVDQVFKANSESLRGIDS